MKTTFIYNGVLVKDVLTDSIEGYAVKDSTGVDQVGVRYVCSFSGIVHQAAEDKTGKHIGSLQSNLFGLLQALTKDRRRFTLRIGGVTIIDIGPGAAEPNAPQNNVATKIDNTDIANGPIPHLQTTKITAGIAATIRFTIEFTIPNCGGPNTGTRGQQQNIPPGLVNFRFWIAEDIDFRTALTTRTYQGRIRVAHKNISPHALARVVTIPPLEDGFQRRVVGWHESEDGLHLDFTFQDVETIAAPPWNRFANVGAIDWQGQLTASTQSMGATGSLDLNFSLTGSKTTSKADLIEIGFLVCQAKVKLLEAIQGLAARRASAFLESLSVTEQLAANTVLFDCKIRHTGDSNLIAGLLAVGPQQVLGRPMGDLGIGYDPEVNFQPKPTAGVGGLFLSVLQTPCQPASMPRTLPQKPPPVQSYRTQQTRSPTRSQNLQQTQALTSQSHRQAVYLEYLMSSNIRYNTGKIALPTGAEQGAGSGSSQSSASDTLAIVNLHRPTARRDILIDASRLDKDPELPASKDFKDANGITHTLIGEAQIITSVPQLSADSRNFLHRTQMQLHYAMSRAPKTGESLPVGTLPYRTSSLSDQRRVLPYATFIDPSRILR